LLDNEIYNLTSYFLDTKTFSEDNNIFAIGVLQRLINYHNIIYYNSEKTLISDYEYDLLKKKLESLEG